MRKPQHGGRNRAGHAHRRREIDPHQAHGVSNRPGHVEIRARQRPVGRSAAPITGGDPPVAEHEAAPIRSDGGHGVGDQRQPFRPGRSKRDAQRCRVDVMAVGDDPAPRVRARQRRAHCARFAAAELGHCVEQVGEAAQPFAKSSLKIGIAGGGVPRGNHHAAIDQRPDRARRRQLRRQGYHSPAALERGEEIDRSGIEPSEFGGIVDARLGGVEERPFNVQSEHPRNALADGRIDCGDGPRDRGGIGADQRGQEPCGPEPAVRGADCRHAIDRRVVVE